MHGKDCDPLSGSRLVSLRKEPAAGLLCAIVYSTVQYMVFTNGYYRNSTILLSGYLGCCQSQELS